MAGKNYTIGIYIKDNFKYLKTAIQGISKEFDRISQATNRVASQSSSHLKAVAQDVNKLIPPNFDARIDKLRGMLSKWGDVTGEVARSGDRLTGVSLKIKGIGQDTEKARAFFEEFKEELSDVKNVTFGISSIRDILKTTTNDYTTFTMKARAGTQAVASSTSVWGIALKTAGQMATSFIRLMVNGLKKIATVIKNAITFTVKLATTIGKTLFNAAKKVVTVLGKIGSSILSIPLAPLRALTSSFGNLATIIAGMVGFSGLKTLGRQLSSLVEEMGPVQSVRVQFVNFMQQATHNVEGFNDSADGLIKKMRDITNGAFDTTQMLKNANLAFSLIGDTVGKELPKMLAIAQAASLATGEDIQRMFSSLVKGVGRLSTRWLDNLGITLSTTEEYERYADTLGKVASELNHAERVQALLTGAMREGTKIMLRTGDTSAFLATQMAALSTSIKNTRDSVISNFAPIFTVLLEVINDFAEESQQKIDQWTRGFTDGFARLPEFIQSASQRLNAGMVDFVEKTLTPIREGKEQMGYEAGRWAADALNWGANVGANFAIGILDGFTSLFVMVVNAIANAISYFFGPGSPPEVAKHIDLWGYQTMEEWVNGMLSYPVSANIESLKKELADVFGGGVKDELFQWGVDSLEAWTKGLSILDLEFLTKAVEKALSKAKRLNEELNRSYKRQNTQLFKMQVLNKDPNAIRQQLTKVKNAKLALKTNEAEISALEQRKDLIQEQLEIMRLLKRAFEKAESARTKKAKGGAGGGGAFDDIGLPAIALPLAGTGKLKTLLEGIRKTFEEALTDPWKRLVEAWDTDTVRMGAAWRRLMRVISGGAAEGSPFDKFRTKVKEVFTDIKNFIAGFAQEMFGVDLAGIFGPLAGAGPKDMPGDILDIERINKTWSDSLDLSKGVNFATGLKTTFENIANAITTGVDLIKTAWGKLKVFLFGAFGGAEPFGMPEGLRNQIESDFGPGLVSMLSSMATNVKPHIDNMVESFGNLGTEILELIQALAGASTIESAIKTIGDVASVAADLVGGFADALARVVDFATTYQESINLLREGKILQGLAKLSEAQLKGVTLPITATLDIVTGGGLTDFEDAIKQSIATTDVSGEFEKVGLESARGWVAGLISGQGEAESSTLDWALAQTKMAEATFRTHSPSEVFADIAKDVVAGFINGIEDETMPSKVTMYKWASDVIKATRISFGAVGMGTPSTVFNQIANDIVTGFRGGFEEDRETLMQYIYDFMDEAVWTAHGVAANAYSVGKAFSGGIEAGIRDGIDGIIKAAQEAAYAAMYGVRKPTETESPSRKFIEIGQDMIAGLNQGLTSPVRMPNVMNGVGAGRGVAGGSSTVIHLHGPIVGTMSVPNRVAGRHAAREISKEISAMAMLKRNPA